MTQKTSLADTTHAPRNQLDAPPLPTKGWIHVLAYLYNGGDHSLTAITNNTPKGKQQTRGIIFDLVAYGLLDVSINPPPHESYRIQLTPKGEQAGKHASELLKVLEVDT